MDLGIFYSTVAIEPIYAMGRGEIVYENGQPSLVPDNTGLVDFSGDIDRVAWLRYDLYLHYRGDENSWICTGQQDAEVIKWTVPYEDLPDTGRPNYPGKINNLLLFETGIVQHFQADNITRVNQVGLVR